MTKKLYEAEDWQNLSWDNTLDETELEKAARKLGYKNLSDDDLIFFEKIYKDTISICISNEVKMKLQNELSLSINLGNLENEYLDENEIEDVCRLMHEAFEVGKKDLEALTK